MNVLMCVDSFFQFIIASNLRLTVYEKDNVDLVIYNSSNNADVIYRNVRETDLYNNVYFADTPLAYCGKQYTFMQKFPKYIIYLKSLVAPTSTILNILGKTFAEKYDQMIFNGDGVLPECIFNACLKRNPDLICFRIEDGYASYMKEFGKEKGKIRRVFERYMHLWFNSCNIRDYISGYYMAEPSLAQIEFPYPVLKAPKISRDNKKLIAVLNTIFEYNPANNTEFKERVIYFEDGSSFFDGGDEELKVMVELVKYIPSHKILVKRHPRRVEDRFKKMGISCCSVNGVPWEIIQLNCAFDGETLISSCSGTLYNSEIYFGDQCKKIFTYRLMNNPPYITKEEHFEEFLESFREMYGDESVLTPGTYEEMKEIVCVED